MESILDLDVTDSDPNMFDDEFWRAYHALNRAECSKKLLNISSPIRLSFPSAN